MSLAWLSRAFVSAARPKSGAVLLEGRIPGTPSVAARRLSSHALLTVTEVLDEEPIDDRNCRPRAQVLDKFLKLLKGTPGQKRTTKSASQTVEPPGTPLPEPELNRQTQQSSRSAHRRAWRCAAVDTLNIQSVTPSTRHQAGLDLIIKPPALPVRIEHALSFRQE